MKRRFSIAAAAIAVVLLGGLAFQQRHRCPITRENFEKIQVGMTEKEVEDILQLPPGDYSTGQVVFDLPPELFQGDSEVDARLLLLILLGKEPTIGWMGDRAIITVFLDATGRVVSKDFTDVRRKSESILDKLRRWIRV
jgi:hypothetical protein